MTRATTAPRLLSNPEEEDTIVSEKWWLEINPSKTVVQIFTKKRIEIPLLRMKEPVIENKKQQRLLGMIFDSPNLTWKPHIEYLIVDCMQRMNIRLHHEGNGINKVGSLS